MTPRIQLLPAAAALVAVAAGSLLGCAGEGTPAGDGSGASPAAPGPDGAPREPSVRVVDLAGLEAELDARRGSGYLLNLWAIWCAPCVAELPELDAVAREWRPEGGDLVTISYDLMVGGTADEAVADVTGFLDERGFTFDVLILDELDYDGINERLELPGGIPVTLAIDAEGRIVDREERRASAGRFEAMMKAALGRE